MHRAPRINAHMHCQTELPLFDPPHQLHLGFGRLLQQTCWVNDGRVNFVRGRNSRIQIEENAPNLKHFLKCKKRCLCRAMACAVPTAATSLLHRARLARFAYGWRFIIQEHAFYCWEASDLCRPVICVGTRATQDDRRRTYAFVSAPTHF